MLLGGGGGSFWKGRAGRSKIYQSLDSPCCHAQFQYPSQVFTIRRACTQVLVEALPPTWEGKLMFVDHMAGFVSIFADGGAFPI